jgi:hypothetical protein
MSAGRKGNIMAKHATDAEVMEYLWPTEQTAQGEQAMNNPKSISVGIAAALLMFSALLFGERAEAGALFPEGTYEKNEHFTMQVTSDGDYRVEVIESGKHITSGFALNEGSGVCTYGDTKGNLWVIDHRGDGSCFNTTVRGNRLIIQDFSGHKTLGGIWIKQ